MRLAVLSVFLIVAAFCEATRLANNLELTTDENGEPLIILTVNPADKDARAAEIKRRAEVVEKALRESPYSGTMVTGRGFNPGKFLPMNTLYKRSLFDGFFTA